MKILKKAALGVLLLVLFIQLINSASAAGLQVEKSLKESKAEVSSDATVLLTFTNPFNQQIPIKIVDKNVFGNNGINIQCMEYTLPNQKEATVAYSAIQPFSSGDYTLEPAEITYTNPDTGKEETIKSNKLDVHVSGSGQGQAQGVTTIYQCGGTNMQSTSYSSSGSSSGSSINVQMGNNGMNIQQQMNNMLNSQTGSQQSSPQERVQNNQMGQNTNALKQQMEKQMQEQEQMKQEFQKSLANNQEFQKEHQKLLNDGYNLTSGNLNPTTNQSGEFDLNYRKPNGETAEMKGSMTDNKIENMQTLTSADKQKMLDALKKNKDFQKTAKELAKQGFNQSQPEFNQISQNETEITIPYQNNQATKKITADYINGTIQNVTAADEQEQDSNNWLWSLLIIPIIIVGSYIIYKKFLKKKELLKGETKKKKIKIEKPIDYFAEAKKMLVKAEKLFADKQEKDAYEKVSQAVRFYLSYKLGLKKDLTSTELVNELRKNKHSSLPKIQNCLNICGMVEFAKYQPNKTDFSKILRIAKRIIA